MSRDKETEDDAGEPVVFEGAPMPRPHSREEALRELRAIAVGPPVEEWAGEVLSPAAAAERLGISVEDLKLKAEAGALIELRYGDAYHICPVAQIVSGRPAEGLADVVLIAQGNAGAAWAWLMRPEPEFGDRAPIELLREGEVDPVLALARRHLGAP